MDKQTFTFSYNTHDVVRRIPNEVGAYWSFLVDIKIGHNEGFYCRSFLDGMHSGGGAKDEMEWLVARDENGNYLICKPRSDADRIDELKDKIIELSTPQATGMSAESVLNKVAREYWHPKCTILNIYDLYKNYSYEDFCNAILKAMEEYRSQSYPNAGMIDGRMVEFARLAMSTCDVDTEDNLIHRYDGRHVTTEELFQIFINKK